MDGEIADALREAARRFYASGAAPVTPRPAATVLLLRPQGPGYQVYLIRRAARMAFAAGMYAFPGGVVDPGDDATGLDLTAPPGIPEAVVCAAIREVFEETGVLLAEGPAEVTEDDRRAVEDRTLGFADLLRDRGLVPRAELLAPWARWITPEFEPRRYDTWFFLARLPGGQRTRRAGGEASHAAWLSPAATAALPMLPPTRAILGDLARYPTIDAAFDAAGRRDAATPVMTRVVDGRLVSGPLGDQPKRPVI